MTFPFTSHTPTHNPDLEEGDKPEKRLLSSEETAVEPSEGRNKRHERTVRLHLIFILACIMGFVVLRGPWKAGVFGAGCHGFTSRLGLNSGYGATRNVSSQVSKKLQAHFTLPSGDRIPAVGLGVWRSEKDKVGDAVLTALKAGYRHIDGAWIYRNEHEVGQAIKASGVARDEIWLTSKLWNTFHDPADVEPAVDETLASLGTDYLDLYLMHWPVAFVKSSDKQEVDLALTNNPYPTWRAMEELVLKGKVKNIGVSNFNIPRLQNLTGNPLRIQPALNQVELSYWNPQPDLLEWAQAKGLLLEAYSPLGSAEMVKKSLEVPEIKKIAKELGMSPAQVYISWAVQRGTVVLPKSVTPSRIEENFQVQALPEEAFEAINKAATSHEPHRSVDPSKSWGVDIFN